MKSIDEYTFTDLDVQRSPVDYFTAMRKSGRVYREPITGAYFVSRAEDIRWVADNPQLFSNVVDPSAFKVCMGGKLLEEKDPEAAQIFREKGWIEPFTLLLNDPPLHGHYRKLANEALSPVKVKQLMPFIQSQVDELIAAFPRDGGVDFVDDFSTPLPLSIIGHFLGAPKADWPMIKGWSDQFFSTQFNQTGHDGYLKTIDAIIEMQHYIFEKMEAQKTKPKDNLLRTLMMIHNEFDCEPLTVEEIMSICHVLLVAGHDTTSQTLSNCLRVIAEFPDLAEILRQQPKKIGAFVNEVLRMYSPAGVTPRFTTEDVEIAGVCVPKDSMVFLAWSSGNRDEDKYQCPHKFDMDRKEKDNFGFGYGIHFCVGFRLARTTLAIALEALLSEFKVIQCTVPIAELEYTASINHRSLVQLPLQLSRN